MSGPPNKRRRLAANPYLDLEAVVDRSNEFEEHEDDDSDRAFIDDGSEGEGDADYAANMYQNRQQLMSILLEEGRLDCSAAVEEEAHAGLLHQLLELKLPDHDDGGFGNPTVMDDEGEIEENEDEVVSVPRPQWVEIAYANAAVSGALSTWQDDTDGRKRQISAQDTLFEVSCKPGMEETIALRIFSWITQGSVSSSLVGAAEHQEREKLDTLRCSGAKSFQTAQKRTLLARSAIANPFLRGRVYIESANIACVQRLAQRVRGLNPASVRPVARELLLRPLLMTRHSFPDRTFVRLLDPPCPSMTCLIVKDYLLMVPRNFSQDVRSSVDKFNSDTDEMPYLPPNPSNGAPTLSHRLAPHQGSIWIDQYGFRYFPLKQLGPSSLEAYEPSAPEVELLSEFGHLSGGQYRTYMSRIRARSLSPGDRVIFRAGAYDQLIGVILDGSGDSSCRVYVPSQGTVIQADRQQLRRHFCVGDRVSATTEDTVQKLGGRVGWVVGTSEGFKDAPFSDDQGADQPKTQRGYKVDLRVYSPASGKEIIAAHYEFQFEDSSAAYLQKPSPPSPVSEMTVGTYYTLTAPLGAFSSRSFFGIITAVDGVKPRHAGAVMSTGLSAAVIFSLWDKNTNTPFGYSEDWTETIDDFLDYDIHLGDVVTLRDQEGNCGTARITSLGKREVSLANFTGALKVSTLESVHRTGPYDDHIGKTVRVVKGPHRGGLGVVKTVNAIGTCVVELNIFPIRKVSVNIGSLCAVDQSALYLSLLPIFTAPPPRAETPPPQTPSDDTPPAFRPSPSDLLPHPLPSRRLDCGWLAHAFAQKMPIKLVPVNRIIQRPYHFSHTFYENTSGTPRLMVHVLDRRKEREFAASELTWLPADDINQTVVRITGQDGSTLYWTIRIDHDSDFCHVRQVPSKRGGSILSFPRLELAQVNAKRT